MKDFTYIMFIPLMLFNAPILAMNALQKKEVNGATIKERSDAIKKAFRKGHGQEIKAFEIDFKDSDLQEITRLGNQYWIPTPEALRDFFNTQGMPKNIVEKSNDMGGYTVASFILYRDENKTTEGLAIKGEPLFFLKIGLKDYEEVLKKLIELEKGPIASFNRNALSNKAYPIIVLHEMFLIYKDKNQIKYGIEVMHLAHGEQVSSIMKNDSDTSIKKDCAEKVGKALGLFHLYFMNYHNSSDPKQWTTMTHGDFHSRNIFFNKKSGRVYFIDNADMRKSNNIWFDLFFFPEKDSFLKGYLSAYPEDKREVMATYLKAKLGP